MANQKNEPKLEQQQLNTHEEEQKSSLNKELQALTIAELNAISGGVISYNHNKNTVCLSKQCQKPKSSSERKSAEVRSLQTFTIADLKAARACEALPEGAADLFEIAGAGLSLGNHNETVVKLAHLSRKPKPSSEDKSVKVTKLPTLTIAELNAIAGGKLGANHNETMIKCSKSN